MIALIHGTDTHSNRSDRIAIAIAGATNFRFAKKVLLLSMSKRFDLVDTLIGKSTSNNKIISRGYTFDDSGLDALLRRMETGSLNAESFSDCCTNIVQTDNGFDVASPSKRADLESFIAKSETFLKRFFDVANKVYDLVLVVGDGRERESLKVLQSLCEREVVVITQGEKTSISLGRKDALYCIDNYDQSSIFNYKRMKELYGVQSDSKMYPVPYNIRFKDSCRSRAAIEFIAKNVETDKTDDDFIFNDCITKLASAVLGQEVPKIVERKFFEKERPSRKRR